VSDSDLLAVQLFIGSLAAGVLFLVITQAGLTQRWLVRGMLILAGALAVSAIFWWHIAPLVSPLDELLESIVGNRLIWFLIGAAVGALVLSLANRSWRRSPFRICLEREGPGGMYSVRRGLDFRSDPRPFSYSEW
jgi:hypothetical protein